MAKKKASAKKSKSKQAGSTKTAKVKRKAAKAARKPLRKAAAKRKAARPAAAKGAAKARGGMKKKSKPAAGRAAKPRKAASAAKPARSSSKPRAAARPAAAAPAAAAPPAHPAVGDMAPDFTAPVSTGGTITLSGLRGQSNVVLYFYPKDDTPGCTVEACQFRDLHPTLTQAGVTVLGVSPDSVDSHGRFIEKFNLPFPLVADEDQSICNAYGVWQQKSMYGRQYMGVARTTFVIDRDGRVARVFTSVNPEGHAAEVQGWLSANLAPPVAAEAPPMDNAAMAGSLN